MTVDNMDMTENRSYDNLINSPVLSTFENQVGSILAIKGTEIKSNAE